MKQTNKNSLLQTNIVPAKKENIASPPKNLLKLINEEIGLFEVKGLEKILIFKDVL